MSALTQYRCHGRNHNSECPHLRRPFPLCVPSDLCGVFRKRPDRGGAEWNTAEIGRNAEREGAVGKAPHSHGRRPACRAGRSGSWVRQSWAGKFGARESEGTNWWRAELAVCATVKALRRARILKSCSIEKNGGRRGHQEVTNQGIPIDLRVLGFLCTTTLQNSLAPRGVFPERGCVRRAPAAARWPHGTSLIPTGASEDSGPLRLVLGGHSRAPWVAAPPLCVHRISVVDENRFDRIVTAYITAPASSPASRPPEPACRSSR